MEKSREAKELAKEQQKKEKLEQLEKQTQEEFAAKKSKASGGPGGDSLKALGVWLENPPFKSTNSDLKKETFISIMARLADLKADQVDKQLTAALDDKQAITLAKYIFKAFELIDKKDQRTLSVINQNQLLKAQLKIQEKYGQCAILKAAFEKNPIV